MMAGLLSCTKDTDLYEVHPLPRINLPGLWDTTQAFIPQLGGTMTLPQGALLMTFGENVAQIEPGGLLMRNLPNDGLDTVIWLKNSGFWSQCDWFQMWYTRQFVGAYPVGGTCPPLKAVKSLLELESKDSILVVTTQRGGVLHIEKLPVAITPEGVTVGTDSFSAITQDSVVANIGGRPASYVFSRGKGVRSINIFNAFFWLIPK